MTRRLTFQSLLVQCGLLAAGLAAYHLVLRVLMSRQGLRLGAVSYKLAPLYAYWRPHLKGWLLLPLVVLGIYLLILRRTRMATSLGERGAMAFFVVGAIAITTSVCMLDNGPRSLIGPLLRTDLEYFGAVDRVRSAAEFLREYPKLASTMPLHAQVHPPGAVLFVWAASGLGGGGPWAAAAGIIAFSSIAVLVVYRWASRLAGPGAARRAAAIYVLTPGCVLFTATSMDGTFAVPLVAAMWLFWEGIERPARAARCVATNDDGAVAETRRIRATVLRPIVLGGCAGLAAAAAAIMTYSVAVAVLFCAIAACVHWFTAPQRRPAVALTVAGAAPGFVGLHAALWLTAGYDPIEMFRVAVANDGRIMSGVHHESLERHAHFFFANLVAFFISAGLPCAVLWWAAVGRLARGWMRERSRRVGPVFVARRRTSGNLVGLKDSAHPTARRLGPPFDCEATECDPVTRFLITACCTLLVAAVVPVYVLEVERIWMFLIPLIVIPVAQRLSAEEQAAGHVRGSLAVAALLAAQTLLTEVLLTTYW